MCFWLSCTATPSHPHSPFMITGEAAQDILPNNGTNNSSSTSGTRTADSAAATTPAKASVMPPTGVQGLAAAVASAAGHKTQRISAVATDLLPPGWQLQKWPVESSETQFAPQPVRQHAASRRCLPQHDPVSMRGSTLLCPTAVWSQCVAMPAKCARQQATTKSRSRMLFTIQSPVWKPAALSWVEV